ncbi:glycoside hydrolase superfamily [Radiomyces spectabilis]|uniref:glycoside hydrolase superfamily n=1 Tax=Radiomyces spectabilis TaxID=64574 RepID=UPI00221EF39C|nr:glycoside hydrolase superfamily [Radiomyces spectabilis]KAI8369440.1 glycoside hydrolase superfamily [Radiomyces spectabilis]
MKFSIAAAATVLLGVAQAKTFLFPIPQSVEWTGHGAALSKDFHITGIDHHNYHVRDAAKRYMKLIRKERWENVQVPYTKEAPLKHARALEQLKIDVEDNNAKLDMNIDESYTLDVPTDGKHASLKAKTWVGALRGLETFSQLILNQDHDLVVHTAKIKDHPSYGHRGIMLDTARNFYPVKDILRTIDAMAYNKMNVLHWHVTDSQSWPMYFKSHPELSDKAAYSRAETYSPRDVRNIISYGESRGVRIVVEIDMPAHTATIGESHPDLMVCRDKFWAEFAAQPPAGQLNPIKPEAWSLVQDMVKEMTERFPDTLYHTGGDEIWASCWPTDKEIKQYVTDHNITYNQLWFDWENKLVDYVKGLKKRPVMWEDPVKDGGDINTDTVIQTWLTPPVNYTSRGYDVIVSNFDYFYLDCGHGGWVGNDDRYISPAQQQTEGDDYNYVGPAGSWCAPFKTWQRIYTYDMTLNITNDQPGKILGGEVALWSEQANHHVIDSRLWPRAAAAAEIYWSGSYDADHNRRTLKEVQPRFNDWVYRLNGRDIGAEPVQPKWCLKHPEQCNLKDPRED